MSRDEASRKLEMFQDGTFLVRVSQSATRRGEYALSIKSVLTNETLPEQLELLLFSKESLFEILLNIPILYDINNYK